MNDQKILHYAILHIENSLRLLKQTLNIKNDFKLHLEIAKLENELNDLYEMV